MNATMQISWSNLEITYHTTSPPSTKEEIEPPDLVGPVHPAGHETSFSFFLLYSRKNQQSNTTTLEYCVPGLIQSIHMDGYGEKVTGKRSSHVHGTEYYIRSTYSELQF